jgi:hypothetical protein
VVTHLGGDGCGSQLGRAAPCHQPAQQGRATLSADRCTRRTSGMKSGPKGVNF